MDYFHKSVCCLKLAYVNGQVYKYKKVNSFEVL